jgi:hypothetical protein
MTSRESAAIKYRTHTENATWPSSVEREQLQHLVFLASQTHTRTIGLDGFGVEIDSEIAGGDEHVAKLPSCS